MGNLDQFVPIPASEMSKGFSSGSLLPMWMAALRVPVAVGMNVTLKVVLPPGVSLVFPRGLALKSTAFVSPIFTVRPSECLRAGV